VTQRVPPYRSDDPPMAPKLSGRRRPQPARTCRCGHAEREHIHGRTTMYYGSCKVEGCLCLNWKAAA